MEYDAETVKYIRDNIGYFIANNDLFSTWLKKGKEFDVSDLIDALSTFNRLINLSHNKCLRGFSIHFKQVLANWVIVQHSERKLSATYFI